MRPSSLVKQCHNTMVESSLHDLLAFPVQDRLQPDLVNMTNNAAGLPDRRLYIWDRHAPEIHDDSSTGTCQLAQLTLSATCTGHTLGRFPF